MKDTVFEEMTKREKLRPYPKEKVGEVYLTYSEGFRYGNEEMKEDHWLCVYGIGLDDNMDTAQTVRIPTYIRMPSGVELRTTIDDRREVVRKAAQQWIDNNLEASRY